MIAKHARDLGRRTVKVHAHNRLHGRHARQRQILLPDRKPVFAEAAELLLAASRNGCAPGWRHYGTAIQAWPLAKVSTLVHPTPIITHKQPRYGPTGDLVRNPGGPRQFRTLNKLELGTASNSRETTSWAASCYSGYDAPSADANKLSDAQ
jgi:hypothetical protein